MSDAAVREVFCSKKCLFEGGTDWSEVVLDPFWVTLGRELATWPVISLHQLPRPQRRLSGLCSEGGL